MATMRAPKARETNEFGPALRTPAQVKVEQERRRGRAKAIKAQNARSRT